MKKNVILVMIITILSRFFGFIRELILANFYGASDLSDAFIVSITIPQLLFSFLGAGIAVGFIPIFSQVNLESKEKGNEFINNLLNSSFLIFIFILIIVLLFTKEITYFFASGLNEETLIITSNLTKITIFSLFRDLARSECLTRVERQ